MKEKIKKKGITRRLFNIVLALAMALTLSPINSWITYSAQSDGRATIVTPLTFTAEDAGATMSFNWKSGNNVQIKASSANVKIGESAATGNWQSYTAGTTITLPAVGDSVSFRAEKIITEDQASKGRNFIIDDGKIAASGDVTSLTNGRGGNSDLQDNCYIYMFRDCKSLTSAPKLPSTKLKYDCYGAMFAGCTSLTSAPELPATSLANYCYYIMFDGCTSLTSAPELPATSLADNCYYGMFKGCTSLASAPELPSIKLKSRCYTNMFDGCTSLTSAPELPATSLEDYCYCGMFNGCTSLASAPELPSTKLKNACYGVMFNGCTSLTSVPELPATILTDDCYYGMFNGCTSLTGVPELPATILTDNCYYEMFKGCTSIKIKHDDNDGELKGIWKIPAQTEATGWNKNMFEGCEYVDLDGSGSKVVELNREYHVPHEHEFEYSAKGSIITAICKVKNCCALDSNKLTLTLSAKSETYTGSAVSANYIPEEVTIWKDAVENDPPKIVYYTNPDCADEHKTTTGDDISKSGAEEVGEAPKNPGMYWAAITVGIEGNQATAKTSFIIYPPHTTEITSSDVIETSGNYYLDSDVTLAAQLVVCSGNTINLDLNGHSLIGNDGEAVISVGNEEVSPANGTLNLFDSKNGGTVTHGNTGSGCGVSVTQEDSIFNMYGGKITGNKGFGVDVGATFNMYDGSIEDNDAGTYSGGGVNAGSSGIFNMYGGSITNNKAQYGGGVYALNTNVITVGGTAKISGNTATKNGNHTENVMLHNGASIAVKDPDPGMSIYVTTLNGEIKYNSVGDTIVSEGACSEYETYFVCDDSSKLVKYDDNKKSLVLANKPTPPSGGGIYRPSTPSESVTSPGTGEGTVQVEATVKDGNAEVKEIPSSEIDKIAESSTTEGSTTTSITIDVSNAKQDVTSVTLPKTTVDKLAKVTSDTSNKIDSVEIRLSTAVIILDAAAIGAVNDQANGNKVNIVLDTTKKDLLNAAQTNAVKDMNVALTFEARVESNGKQIHDFKGGNAIVNVVIKVEADKNPKFYHVYYISETGELEKFATRFVDGILQFTTGHFSDYIIVYDESEPNATEEPAPQPEQNPQPENPTPQPEQNPQDTQPQPQSQEPAPQPENPAPQPEPQPQPENPQPVKPVQPTAVDKANNAITLNAGFKVSQTGKDISVKWGKVTDADGYMVYVAKCGTSFGTAVKTVKANTTSVKITKLDGKKLDTTKNYKAYVVAYKVIDGKKVVIGKTIIAHIVGSTNAKYTNVSGINLKKTSYTLYESRSAKINASVKLVDKTKKQLTDAHAKQFRYATTNSKIVKVSKDGKIEAVGVGTCYVYVYARNGYAKKIKVTVKIVA